MPHYVFLSHQVYTSEFPAKLIFMLMKLFSLEMAQVANIQDSKTRFE